MKPRKKDLIDVLLPILGIVFVLFLCLHMAVAYEQTNSAPRLDTLTGSKAFDLRLFLDLTLGRLENNPADIEYAGFSTIMFLGYGVGFCFFFWAYVTTTRKKLIPGKEFGTAEWGKPASIAYLAAARQIKLAIKDIKKKKRTTVKTKKKRIKAAREKYRDSDILLTKTEKFCIYNREINNNTLVIGGAGSGKTRSYVLPNILQAHSSYIITDPKAEIFEKTAHFLAQVKHYKIRVLNLDVMSMSDGYNPFYYIHMEREGWEERVLTLIETIIINTDGGEKRHSSDPFWEKAERLFLQSLFFAVLQAYKPEEQTMNSVLKLMGDLRLEDDNDCKDSKLDQFFDDFAKKYSQEHIAVQQYREFRDKASGRTAKSIVISASARLSPFRISGVRRIFSYDGMCLDKAGEEKTAIFIIVPPTNKTFSFIAGMLFTQLFQELSHCALNVHKREGQQLPVPCRLILDEFANTCIIPNFVQILAYARSLGISITTILQSLEQIKKMYKDEWGVIVDNCNSLLYLGSVSHVETLEYLSKSLGKGTYDKKDYSRSRGRHGSSTTSNNRIGRELMLPDEIRNIPNTACILFIGGKSPFYSQKINLKQHRNYRYTSEADEKNIIDYMPGDPPQKTEIKPTDEIKDAVDDTVKAVPDSTAFDTPEDIIKDMPDDVADDKESENILDGLDEAMQENVIKIDMDPADVQPVMDKMNKTGSASFLGVSTDDSIDENEEQATEAIAEINAALYEEENDKPSGLFIGVSTELDDFKCALEDFAWGEAHGVPTTFGDTTHTEPGDIEIEDYEVIASVLDYDTIYENASTENFKNDLKNIITDNLREGKNTIDYEKGYGSGKNGKSIEASL